MSLDTLNDKDFVSIVFFNDQVHPLVSCNELDPETQAPRLKFIQATPRNQEILKEFVWVPFDTRNIADFVGMFKTAYNAFRLERKLRNSQYSCSDIR